MAQSKIDGVMEKHFDEYESTEFAGLVRALEAGEEPTRQAVSAELSAVLEMEMPEDDVVVDDILGLFKGKGKNGAKATPPVKAKKEKKGKATPAKTESEPEEETPIPPVKEKKAKKAPKKTESEPEVTEPETEEAKPEKVLKAKKEKAPKKAKTESEPEASESEAPAKEKKAKTESEPEEGSESPKPRKRNDVSEFTRLVSMTMKEIDFDGCETEYYTEPSFEEKHKSRKTAANLELFAKFQNKKLSLKEIVETTVKAMKEAMVEAGEKEKEPSVVVVSGIVRGFFQKECRVAMLAKASLPEPEPKPKRNPNPKNTKKSKKETEA